MFILKAIIMLIIPFYRVSIPLNIYPQNLTYLEYFHGTIVTRKMLSYNSDTYVALRVILAKQAKGWKYDFVTYAPNHLFSSSTFRVNCIDNKIIINYEQRDNWVQVSKVISAPCPSP